MPSDSPLIQLRTRLAEKLREPTAVSYRVPGRWLHINHAPAAVFVNPYQFWLNAIDHILSQPPAPLVAGEGGGEWSRYASIYNLLLRSAAAFDHDGDGTLGRPNQAGFNETGSFVKGLAMLPYIKALGCNTVHLLPVTAVGQDGNKGDAGSPYAIRNPYRLDETLAEPNLELGVETEFAAFVEAAHHLGVRVVLEFVFRTSSKDGDWVQEHPEWFYWIDARIEDRAPGTADEQRYGMPVFTEAEVEAIEEAVDAGELEDLPPPHQVHQAMFLPPPRAQDVVMENGRWLAKYPDGRTGRIPGAFADWPVDDPQPPWGDVTYLRLYDHPDFNYIAYNTIRMYDTRLAQPQNAVRPLWDHVTGIIPHYQETFGIDGAMIDMGHALPTPLKQEMVASARGINPDFAFWDENFSISRKSRQEGYNAVIGGLPFVMPYPKSVKSFLREHAREGKAIPFFGAPESHNTPRAASKQGGATFVRYASAIAAFLPAIPFVHCGVEFGETWPVNTGLGFTPGELRRYSNDKLPLFSAMAYDWTGDTTDLTGWWRQTIALRQQQLLLFSDLRPQTFELVGTDNSAVEAIMRHTDDWAIKLALVINHDIETSQSTTISLPTGRQYLMDHYTRTFYEVKEGQIEITLNPGQCLWLEL